MSCFHPISASLSACVCTRKFKIAQTQKEGFSGLMTVLLDASFGEESDVLSVSEIACVFSNSPVSPTSSRYECSERVGNISLKGFSISFVCTSQTQLPHFLHSMHSRHIVSMLAPLRSEQCSPMHVFGILFHFHSSGMPTNTLQFWEAGLRIQCQLPGVPPTFPLSHRSSTGYFFRPYIYLRFPHLSIQKKKVDNKFKFE